jgi:hypothetical protein
MRELGGVRSSGERTVGRDVRLADLDSLARWMQPGHRCEEFGT